MIWTPEMKAVYVACAIDTDGWVALRPTERADGTFRLTPNVGVTNQDLALLRRIAEFAGVPENFGLNGEVGRDSRGIVTKERCYQAYWRSPPHVVLLLEMALPYLLEKQERAQWVLEFARRRINESGAVARKDRPYTDRDWDLCEMVCESNGKRGRPVVRPERSTA